MDGCGICDAICAKLAANNIHLNGYGTSCPRFPPLECLSEVKPSRQAEGSESLQAQWGFEELGMQDESLGLVLWSKSLTMEY